MGDGGVIARKMVLLLRDGDVEAGGEGGDDCEGVHDNDG